MTTRRAKPGAEGGGNYFRIVVRDKDEFTTFRYHDIGKKGHIQRLAGKRTSNFWDTQAWLISKQDAHMEGDRLVADTNETEELLSQLGSVPKHLKGDIFEAQDRPNIPEYAKPAPRKEQQAHWQAVAHDIRKKLK